MRGGARHARTAGDSQRALERGASKMMNSKANAPKKQSGDNGNGDYAWRLLVPVIVAVLSVLFIP